MRKAALAAALAAALLLPLAAQAPELVAPEAIFPPWQHGQNNDAAQRGLAFTVPEVTISPTISMARLPLGALIAFGPGHRRVDRSPDVPARGTRRDNVSLWPAVGNAAVLLKSVS